MAAGWLLLDQVTKWWAEGELADQPIDLVWTLRLRLVTNSGASFSMGEGMGPYIGVVALVVVGVLLWTGRSIGSRFGAVGLGLVLGGALGNVLDRAFRSGDGFMGGSVIDWIDVQWWPIFNVADIGVVVGAIMLMFASLWADEDDEDDEDDDEPDPTDADGRDDAAGASVPPAGPDDESSPADGSNQDGDAPGTRVPGVDDTPSMAEPPPPSGVSVDRT